MNHDELTRQALEALRLGQEIKSRISEEKKDADRKYLEFYKKAKAEADERKHEATDFDAQFLRSIKVRM